MAGALTVDFAEAADERPTLGLDGRLELTLADAVAEEDDDLRELVVHLEVV